MTQNTIKTTAETSIDADSEMLDSEISMQNSFTLPEGVSSGDDSLVDKKIQEFILALKQEFAQARDRERKKIRQVYTEHVRRIESQARKTVRQHVREANKSNQKKLAEREQRINALSKKVNLLARDIAHQKKELEQSRDRFNKKLLESDSIQTDLRDLGDRIGQQVGSLGNDLLNEHFMEDREIPVKNRPARNLM